MNPVTLTVTDNNGATDNCAANVTVADNVNPCPCNAPVAVCQDITVQLDAGGNASIVPTDIDGGSTADCGLSNMTASVTAFDCDDKGDVTVTLTVTDINAASDNCDATVTVADDTNPCPCSLPVAVCQNVTCLLYTSPSPRDA